MYEKLKDMVDGILMLESIDISTINPLLTVYRSHIQRMMDNEQELAPQIKPLLTLIKQLDLTKKTLSELELSEERKELAEKEIASKEKEKETLEGKVREKRGDSEHSYTILENQYNIDRCNIEPTAAAYTYQNTKDKITLVKGYLDFLKTQMTPSAKSELIYLEYKKKRIVEQLRAKYTAILQSITTVHVLVELEEAPIDKDNAAFISFLQKAIKTYKEYLQGIANEGATIKEELNKISSQATDLNSLKERANTFVKKYFPLLAIPHEDLLATEILLVNTAITDLLTNVTTQLEPILTLEAWIKEYQEAERITQNFRLLYKITAAPSCTPEQFDALERSALERQEHIKMITDLMDTCSACEKKLSQLKTEEDKLKKKEELIKKMKKNLAKKYGETMTVLESKAALSKKLIELVQKIQEIGREIPWDALEASSTKTSAVEEDGMSHALELLDESSEEESVAAKKYPPIISHSDDYYTLTAAKMNNKIRQQFGVLLSPNELQEEGCCSPKKDSDEAYELTQFSNLVALQQWYIALYDALPSESNHQVTQLLRDIYFELDNPNEEQCAVLEHYRSLCPNPAEDDYKPLLQFKPKIRPEDTSLFFIFDENEFAHNNKIKDVLKALYQQVQALQKNHKREALLLNQLTDNLKLVASAVTKPELNSALEYKEKELSIKQKRSLIEGMNNFQHDPRYLSLHKHRGFHKLTEWFAQLWVDIVAGCNSLPKEDYRTLCFFKPTHTIDLIEKATQAIEAACPKMDAG